MEQERVFPPSKFIKDKLMERGWKQVDLARILGKTPSKLNSLMADNKRMSPEFAQELAVAFEVTPEYWLSLDNSYRLSQANYVDKSIEHRSMIFRYPFKDMQKRQWIAAVTEPEALENELKRFFEVDDLNDLPVEASFRRTFREAELNPPERAWLKRAKRLARACPADPFDEGKLPSLGIGLRRLAAKSKAVHRVPGLLGKYGIRFIIVEPLPRVKIDGAAFWLDETSPVIAMSVRFDNIGSFWFTLMHEFFHIKHRDAFSFDDLESLPTDNREIKANQAAAETLVPQQALERFVQTYRPRFSEALINNLATQLAIHPGIIVGQLQHRKEIGYNYHRKLTVKVRELVTVVAFTDGWGCPVPQV